MISAERVAALALAYEELAKGSATGPREGFDNLLDDFEHCPGEVSLLAMIGSGALSDLDWEIVRAMEYPEGLPALAANLAPFDPHRAEALFHAEASEPPRACCLDALERWEAVEQAMQRLRDLGVTTTRDDLELVGSRAYMSASGATLDEYLDLSDD